MPWSALIMVGSPRKGAALVTLLIGARWAMRGRAPRREEIGRLQSQGLGYLYFIDEIFLPNQSPIGERLRLNNVDCQVIGVFATRGSVGGNGDDDNSVFMPLTNVQRRFTGNDNIGYMAVSYDGSYDSATMTKALVDLMRERRVLLATPTNLVAIARTVATVWRQETLAVEAAEIGRLGKELHARLQRGFARLGERARDRLVEERGAAVDAPVVGLDGR